MNITTDRDWSKKKELIMDHKEQLFSESFRGNDFTREFLNEMKWTRQIMVVIMFTLIWMVISSWGLHCQ